MQRHHCLPIVALLFACASPPANPTPAPTTQPPSEGPAGGAFASLAPLAQLARINQALADHDPALVPELVAFVNTPSRKGSLVLEEAVTAIGVLGGPEYAQLVLSAPLRFTSTDGGWQLRLRARHAAARYGDDAVPPALAILAGGEGRLADLHRYLPLSLAMTYLRASRSDLATAPVLDALKGIECGQSILVEAYERSYQREVMRAAGALAIGDSVELLCACAEHSAEAVLATTAVASIGQIGHAGGKAAITCLDRLAKIDGDPQLGQREAFVNTSIAIEAQHERAKLLALDRLDAIVKEYDANKAATRNYSPDAERLAVACLDGAACLRDHVVGDVLPRRTKGVVAARLSALDPGAQGLPLALANSALDKGSHPSLELLLLARRAAKGKDCPKCVQAIAADLALQTERRFWEPTMVARDFLASQGADPYLGQRAAPKLDTGTVRANPDTRIKGALNKEVIRGIVRGHIADVRSCYNQGLLKDPALAGRVEVNFVITTTGAVGASDVQTNSLTDDAVGPCIAEVIKTWKFPKPKGGGNVIVTYPFTLTPG